MTALVVLAAIYSLDAQVESGSTLQDTVFFEKPDGFVPHQILYEVCDVCIVSKDTISLGTYIRLERELSGMTIEQVSEATGIRVDYIIEFEAGSISPTMDVMFELSKAIRGNRSEVHKNDDDGGF